MSSSFTTRCKKKLIIYHPEEQDDMRRDKRAIMEMQGGNRHVVSMKFHRRIHVHSMQPACSQNKISSKYTCIFCVYQASKTQHDHITSDSTFHRTRQTIHCGKKKRCSRDKKRTHSTLHASCMQIAESGGRGGRDSSSTIPVQIQFHGL
jgi:hypothetical protein